MRDGIEPETRHYNCILRAEAIFQGVFNARKTLDEMMEGRLGKKIVPNIESYNALLEVGHHSLPCLWPGAIKLQFGSCKSR